MFGKLISASAAALLILSCLASCGASDGGGKVALESGSSEITGSDATQTVTEEEYAYPETNYGGKAFRVYNIADLWDMYVDLDKPELTGEALDDAVYERNRRIEDKARLRDRRIRVRK